MCLGFPILLQCKGASKWLKHDTQLKGLQASEIDYVEKGLYYAIQKEWLQEEKTKCGKSVRIYEDSDGLLKV